MKGLVLKSPGIDHVLAGKQTWLLRGTATSIRGRIALLKSRSGQILGTCRITDCVGPLTVDQLKANADKHQLATDTLPNEKTFAWVVAEAKALAQPITCTQRFGSAVWVTLSAENTGGRISELEGEAAAAPGAPAEPPKVEVTVHVNEPQSAPAGEPVAS